MKNTWTAKQILKKQVVFVQKRRERTRRVLLEEIVHHTGTLAAFCPQISL